MGKHKDGGGLAGMMFAAQGGPPRKQDNTKVLVRQHSGIGSQLSFLRHKSFEQELEDDNIDDEILETEIQAQAQDQITFRQKLVALLTSNPVQITMGVLVLIDVLLMVALLMLDIHIVQGKCNTNLEYVSNLVTLIKERYGAPELTNFPEGGDISTLIRVLELAQNETDGVHKRDLRWIQHGNLHQITANDAISDIRNKNVFERRKRSDDVTAVPPLSHTTHQDHHSLSKNKSLHTGGSLLHAEKHSTVETVAHSLHISSIVILAIFVLEAALKMFGMGFSFFKKKLEILDAFIIVVSFTVDLVFYNGIGALSGVDAASLLIFFLMWRMLRVFNGFLITSRKRLKFRLNLQMRARKRAEGKYAEMQKKISVLEAENNNLTELAEKYGAKKHELYHCKARGAATKHSTADGISSFLALSVGFMQHLASSNDDINEEPLADILEESEDGSPVKESVPNGHILTEKDDNQNEDEDKHYPLVSVGDEENTFCQNTDREKAPLNEKNASVTMVSEDEIKCSLKKNGNAKNEQSDIVGNTADLNRSSQQHTSEEETNTPHDTMPATKNNAQAHFTTKGKKSSSSSCDQGYCSIDGDKKDSVPVSEGDTRCDSNQENAESLVIINETQGSFRDSHSINAPVTCTKSPSDIEILARNGSTRGSTPKKGSRPRQLSLGENCGGEEKSSDLNDQVPLTPRSALEKRNVWKTNNWDTLQSTLQKCDSELPETSANGEQTTAKKQEQPKTNGVVNGEQEKNRKNSVKKKETAQKTVANIGKTSSGREQQKTTDKNIDR